MRVSETVNNLSQNMNGNYLVYWSRGNAENSVNKKKNYYHL